MVTQEFLSDLWTPVLTYKNIAVRKSYAPASIQRASNIFWCGTGRPRNPQQSKGGSQDGYRAPVQFVIAQPPASPPTLSERNIMNPPKQQAVNLAMEKIAVPDPRMNITGNYVPTTERLANMDIQTAPFNYNAIFGVVGILAVIVGIVWLARRK